MKELEIAEKSTFGWTAQKLMAVQYLIEGKSVQETAQLVNCHPDTVYDWRKRTEFGTQIEMARNEIRERLVNRQVTLAEEALEKTADLMRRGSNKQKVQLDAALALIKAGLPLVKEAVAEQNGQTVKVVVVNNTLLTNRKQELSVWEEEMGYKDVTPPTIEQQIVSGSQGTTASLHTPYSTLEEESSHPSEEEREEQV